MAFPEPFYRSRPHPWHGLQVGPEPPRIVNSFIELTPFDLVKYEVDKVTGYLVVDRPQRTSSQPPAPYGFIPRTYCGQRVADLSAAADRGDGDPLDVCVLCERPINRGEVVLRTRVIGGLMLVDRGEADDKIIAVLENDDVWKDAREIDDVPAAYIERLRHFFATYKMIRGEKNPLSIEKVYGAEHAQKVITAAMEDYRERYDD